MCENCIKRGCHGKCQYARSPWIDIIASENKAYEEIDALKQENDNLIASVESLNREVLLMYKRGHTISAESEENHPLLATDEDWSSFVDSALVPDAEHQFEQPTFIKPDYHFLKDSVEIPLRNRLKMILSSDSILIQPQLYSNVKYQRLTTPFRALDDPSDKRYFLDNLTRQLPPFPTVGFHLDNFFTTNYHKHLPLLSRTLLIDSFQRIFSTHSQQIELDPGREAEDFLQLSIILLVLKICSIYKGSGLVDHDNIFLQHSYIASELGGIQTRASIAALQASLLMTSFRMFSHKVPDQELFFSTERCRDMAIALGIHKNTEIIYEMRSNEEREVLRNIKLLLNCGH